MYTPLTEEQYNKAIKSGFSPQDIISMERKRKELENKKPGYFESVFSEYKRIGEGIVSGIQKGAEQTQQGGSLNVAGGLTRGALRTVGGVAEAAFTPILEAPGVKQATEAVGSAITKIPGVDVLAQKVSELSSKYPEISKDLKNILDIATLGGGKAVEKPTGIALEKAGQVIEKSGLEASKIGKESFALKLVKPIEDKATKLAQVSRTAETPGFFKTNTVIPTKVEEEMAKIVSSVPGVSETNTFQKNFNVIRDFNVGEAKQLESDIAQFDFLVPRKETISRLNTAALELKSSPLVVGDAAKTAQRLIEGAKKFINENSGSGSGVLKARKDYDAWVLSQKPKVFDSTAENAFTVANNAVRETLNTILDEKAVNLGIKDSLRRQSMLYRAMDNIAPKAAEEANTKFGRMMQNVGKTIGTKNKIVQAVAAAAGIGGLGAAATFAPAAAVIGGSSILAYKAGKFVLKPEVRINLGKLLQQFGKSLNPTDRATIQELLNDYSEKVNVIKNDSRGIINPKAIAEDLFPKAIDPATKAELTDAIDYIRLEKPLNKDMEIAIDRLAQKFGISQDLSSAQLANKFEELVSKTKTKLLPGTKK